MSRAEVLSLYRRMLRSARKFHDYNFQSYALRRVRDGFREHAGAPPEQVPSLLLQGRKDAEVLERQAVVNAMYAKADHVIGHYLKQRSTQGM